MTDQDFEEAGGRALHMRPVEYTILALILAKPGLTARQLSRGLAVTPPNIAPWIERLEGRGLIARTRGERDASVQHIMLTWARSEERMVWARLRSAASSTHVEASNDATLDAVLRRREYAHDDQYR